MGRWFGRRPDDPAEPSAEVELWRDDDGIVLAGPNDVVASIVSRLESVGGSGVIPSPVAPAEALAVFATGFADGATSAQYIRHTPESLELLQRHGAIPNGRQGFRSVVHDGERIVGNLDWEIVSAGPERALAFQSAAIGMALRTAVKQVEAAVERVEGKVDRIAAFLQAERLGQILGDRRTLESLVTHLDSGEALAAADWASIAPLGPAITSDLEKLRAHVRRIIADADDGADLGDRPAWRPSRRADGVDALLADGVLAETLALVVVAEHNLSLWQRLRLEHIGRHEPEHLESATIQARSTLRGHHELDQELHDQLRSISQRLLSPRELDGLALRQSSRLRKAEEQVELVLSGFATHRHLDVDASALHRRPSIKDSIEHIGGWTGDRLGQARDTVLRRGDIAAQPELPEVGDGSNIYED